MECVDPFVGCGHLIERLPIISLWSKVSNLRLPLSDHLNSNFFYFDRRKFSFVPNMEKGVVIKTRSTAAIVTADHIFHHKYRLQSQDLIIYLLLKKKMSIDANSIILGFVCFAYSHSNNINL